MSLENKLLHAVRNRNLGLTQQLIAEGVNVNITEGAENDKTVLHRATRNNDIEIARELLGAGASPKTLDKRNCSPLRTAITFGSFELVKLLFDKGSNVDPQDLYVAVKNQRKDVVELLLEHEADLKLLTSGNENVLSLAAESRNVTMDCGDQSYVDILKLLLSHSAQEVTMPDKPVVTSKLELESALSNCFPAWYLDRFNPAEGEFNYDIRKSSISRKLDRCVNDEFATKTEPLKAVLENGSVEALSLFLKYGFKLNMHGNLLPLHCAARNRDDKVLEFLLKRGDLNIEEKDPTGLTALHTAVKYHKLKSITILIQFGADVNSSNREGDTPLITAVRERDLASTEILLNSGASVNHSNQIGETPWYIAFTKNQIACVELLVVRGADFKLRRECQFHDMLDQVNIELMKPLIRHLALFVSQQRFNDLENYLWLMNKNDEKHNDKSGSKYLDECEIELANLETTAIYGSYTFYDFLTLGKICSSQLTNQCVLDIFEPERLKNMFPIYGMQMYQSFTKMRQLMILRRKALGGLSRLLTFDVRTFHAIGDKIVQYLHERDLRSLSDV